MRQPGLSSIAGDFAYWTSAVRYVQIISTVYPSVVDPLHGGLTISAAEEYPCLFGLSSFRDEPNSADAGSLYISREDIVYIAAWNQLNRPI